MTTQITGKLLRDRVRAYREKRPERPFTTVEKILIAAEVVKRESRPKRGQNSAMNDADLIHACFGLFSDYDGCDKDLYLRGKAPTTIPMVRPTLVRDLIFGRNAPLKRWMRHDPKTGTYLLTAAGSVHVHTLLLSEGRRRKPPLKRVDPLPGTAAPFTMSKPTLEQLEALQQTCWRDRSFIKDLRRLDFVKKPTLRMINDIERLLQVINRHRGPEAPPAREYLRQSIERMKTLVMAEALFDGTPESLEAGERKTRSLDILFSLTDTVLRKDVLPPPLHQRYQKPRSGHALRVNA